MSVLVLEASDMEYLATPKAPNASLPSNFPKPTPPQTKASRKVRATRKLRTEPKGLPLMLWGWPLDENFFVPGSQNHLDCGDDIGEIYCCIHPILREHRLIYRIPIKAVNIKSKPNLVLYFATNQSSSRMKKMVKTEGVERFMEAADVAAPPSWVRTSNFSSERYVDPETLP
ncbi:hypothetical protein ARMSODRAFT_521159 [Armillaria solidipes]|uniref:Uncharacterized protein n=1 Tax=Armillaria solidipes TaxID=1076256 RepID=A0A2H3BLH7_9AGAR|nr:hypothetical protein ARMSODRAFT_521159 [Armillaria solidipes]